MDQESHPDEAVLCHRCGRTLQPGRGNHYLVRIEALADPSPPDIDPMDLHDDLHDEIDSLIENMSSQSPRELMDQVHRRLTLTLCTPCYSRWIEDPTG